MLTGLLRYAERVQPGWISDGFSFGLILPGGLIGVGEHWCMTFLSVAHGEANLRAVDRNDWTAWRDVALMRTTAFREEFDPHSVLVMFAGAAGLDFEDLCRRLGDDDGPDPFAEVARRMPQ
jgi:hypothetical protein